MKNPKFVANPLSGNYFAFAGKDKNQGYYWISNLRITRNILCSSYKILEYKTSPFRRCSIFPVKIPNGFVARLSYDSLCISYLNSFIPKHAQKLRNLRIFLKTCTLQKTVPLVVFYNDEFKLYCDVNTGKNIYYENKQI